MENSKWRFWARLAGWVSLFYSAFTVAYALYLNFLDFVRFPEFMNEEYTSFLPYLVSWVPYFYHLFLDILAGLHVLSGIQLIRAAKEEVDELTAWRRCDAWGILTYTVVIVGSIINVAAVGWSLHGFKEVFIWIILTLVIVAVPYFIMGLIVVNFEEELGRVLIAAGFSPASDNSDSDFGIDNIRQLWS